MNWVLAIPPWSENKNKNPKIFPNKSEIMWACPSLAVAAQEHELEQLCTGRGKVV